MSSFVKFTAIAVVLSACVQATPEERAAQSAEESRLTMEVMQGMATPAPAAVTACISQIETGSFSEAALLSAGYRKGNALLSSAYVVDVSGPVNFSLATRPLSMGINVGPAAAINFQSGCKVNLPSQGNSAIAFAAAAQSVATAQGYSFTLSGGGSYTFEKAGSKIQMQITRTIMNGNSFVEARMSKAN